MVYNTQPRRKLVSLQPSARIILFTQRVELARASYVVHALQQPSRTYTRTYARMPRAYYAQTPSAFVRPKSNEQLKSESPKEKSLVCASVTKSNERAYWGVPPGQQLSSAAQFAWRNL